MQLKERESRAVDSLLLSTIKVGDHRKAEKFINTYMPFYKHKEEKMKLLLAFAVGLCVFLAGVILLSGAFTGFVVSSTCASQGTCDAAKSDALSQKQLFGLSFPFAGIILIIFSLSIFLISHHLAAKDEKVHSSPSLLQSAAVRSPKGSRLRSRFRSRFRSRSRLKRNRS